jgi:hypothetical protein
MIAARGYEDETSIYHRQPEKRSGYCQRDMSPFQLHCRRRGALRRQLEQDVETLALPGFLFSLSGDIGTSDPIIGTWPQRVSPLKPQYFALPCFSR